MRSKGYACRVGKAAPLLTAAEYALIRPMVPIVLGDQGVKRPSYVPQGSVYVGRNARRQRRNELLIVWGVLLMVLSAVSVAMIIAWSNTATARGVPDPGYLTTPPTATPTTYGAPR